MTSPPAEITSQFFREELEQALRENGYAIMAWEVMEDDRKEGAGAAAHAEAVVELLPEHEANGDKGENVTVQVTMQGYAVVKDQAQAGKTFETLDDLLAAHSPAYSRRRQKLLFAKLEEVAQARSWDDAGVQEDDNS